MIEQRSWSWWIIKDVSPCSDSLWLCKATTDCQKFVSGFGYNAPMLRHFKRNYAPYRRLEILYTTWQIKETFLIACLDCKRLRKNAPAQLWTQLEMLSSWVTPSCCESWILTLRDTQALWHLECSVCCVILTAQSYLNLHTVMQLTQRRLCYILCDIFDCQKSPWGMEAFVPVPWSKPHSHNGSTWNFLAQYGYCWHNMLESNMAGASPH